MCEDFTGFALCKAYDVISDGAFRKHLVTCRDRGDAWAVKMHNEQGKIGHMCRDVLNSINHLYDVPHNREWARICKDVLGSAQPPIKVFTGPSVCSITGDRLECSLDLTKNGKNAKETKVHLKFWHFFIFLWYVSKAEYIIRSCTKQWLEEIGRIERVDEDLTQLCERFKEEHISLIQGMSTLFNKAHTYVAGSIEMYKQEFEITMVVVPPAEFFSAQD